MADRGRLPLQDPPYGGGYSDRRPHHGGADGGLLPPAGEDNAYLKLKGVQPLGDLRQAKDGSLVLPVLNAEGKLVSLQFIDSEGGKRFLSGGEVKRVEIATILARRSGLMILDEPEAGIDLWSFNNLIEVFENMRENTHGSIVIISHQERILNIADEIVVISEGSILKHGPKDEILPEILGTASAMSGCPAFRREA